MKDIYGINKNESLYLLRHDIEQEGLNNPSFGYELYYPINDTNLKKLDLSNCEGIKINNTIPVNITGDLDLYNISSDYYNDICYIKDSDDKTDISLFDRKNDYINNNMSLCDINCDFIAYNYETKEAVCSCGIKTEIPLLKDIKFDKDVLFKSFTDINNLVNTKMMTCYKTVFEKKNIIKNIGCFIFVAFILLNLILIFLFCFKYFGILVHEIKKFKSKIIKRYKKVNANNNSKSILTSKKNKDINIAKKHRGIIINKNKTHNIKKHKEIYLNKNDKKKHNNSILNTISRKSKKINSKNSLKNHHNRLNNNLNIKLKKRKTISLNLNKTKHKKNKIQNKLELYNSELNDLKYKEALIKDKRTYIQYYISLLKINHNIFFLFNSDNLNSKIIKISIFIFNLSSLITVNTLFFTDSTMHKIYIDKGSFNFIYQLPQTIYSAIITGILDSIIKFLGFSESNILELKRGNINNINKREKDLIHILKIKFIIFYSINFILITLFWYYVTCFCGIYRNTQIHLFKDTLLSFITSSIIPFIKYLFPGIFRICGLKRKNKFIYKVSKILQKF